MNDSYKIPSNARIGHVHLKVSDLNRSLGFYCDLLGFEVTTMYGKDAAFISAGGYHHHIGLNTWYSKNAPRPETHTTGLFHVALLYPTRKDLATIFSRLQKAGYPISGAADHGVSEAVYLEDPDGNGIELYCDRPKESWTYNTDGSVEMVTNSLDIRSLMSELDKE